MAKKLLVPVFPSDRFYEAVVISGEILADEGGVVAFAFTKTRPSPQVYEDDEDGQPSLLDISFVGDEMDPADLEKWREEQVAALEEARVLLYQRGVSESQIDYLFLDVADGEGAAQAIADEAAAGAYDMVVLARGYFENEVPNEDSTPQDVARAVQDLEGPRLVVA